MRILTIAPSIYPDKLTKMVDSYYQTVSASNLCINSNEKSVTEAFNKIFNKYPDFDFYFMANDDIEFKTKDWDLLLANKGRISHGNDSIENGVKGQFMMIDGDIARAVGWLQLPTLNKYCGDVIWRFIGDQLRILNYVPSVEITHNWEGADEQINKEDMKNFAEWLPESYKDLNKIKGVL